MLVGSPCSSGLRIARYVNSTYPRRDFDFCRRIGTHFCSRVPSPRDVTGRNPSDSCHLRIITNGGEAWHGRCSCHPPKETKVVDLMKIDISFLAAFLLIGNDLLARSAVQGIEQAIVSTAIEYGAAGVIHLSKWGRASRELCFRR
jgi:hypothetical protein